MLVQHKELVNLTGALPPLQRYFVLVFYQYGNVRLNNRMGLTLSNVRFVYKAWQHMTIFNAEVVMRTKHISGNYSCIATPMLLEICPVKHTHTILQTILTRLTL